MARGRDPWALPGQPVKCGHGVAFFGDPKPTCPRCDLEWHAGMMLSDLESAARHKAKIEQLEREIAASAAPE